MAPIKVGLMGYGFSTKCFHVPFIAPNPDLEIYAFLQRAEAPSDKSGVEEGKHCTVDHPKAKHYRTPDDFFADKEIELVVVCTGVDTHAKFAEQALRAGKHAVVEKPFTITSKEADHLISVQKETGKTITVFQNRRYDSDFRTLQQLLSAKVFGKITEFENHYDLDNPEWVQKWTDPGRIPGEGMLYGLGTHSIDQTLLLFGRPKSVTAFTRALRMESETDDSFTVILQYGGEQKDMIATVKTTIVSPLPKQLKWFVRGTEGAFTKPGEDVQIDHLFAGMKADDPKFGIEPESYIGTLSTKKEFKDASQSKDKTTGIYEGKYPSAKGEYMDFYRDVVASIRGEKEVYCKPEQSRDGIRVIELAQESAEKGVTVQWS